MTKARAMINRTVAAAKSLDDPFTLAITLHFTSAAAQMLGDIPLATINSELSMQMATEHDLAQPKAWSMGVAGWCAAENGDPDRGLALATQAIATLQEIQSYHQSAYLFGLLADILLNAGHYVKAMKVVEEGLTMAEPFYSAELHRLRGELLARAPAAQTRKAQASFRTAIRIAKQQGAKTLERKAKESLRRWSAANRECIE
jgi:tetratricopeptide (TPR) repeat protein